MHCPPALQVFDRPRTQATQAAPPTPQLPKPFCSQVLPLQQPVQDGSQTQEPPEHT
jgi:hypothetical protein